MICTVYHDISGDDTDILILIPTVIVCGHALLGYELKRIPDSVQRCQGVAVGAQECISNIATPTLLVDKFGLMLEFLRRDLSSTSYTCVEPIR